MRLKRLALALGLAAVFTAGGALYAQANHGGAEGTMLTGCLNPGGQLKNLAIGDAPSGGGCGRNETLVHLGNGDITSVRTDAAGGLQGGTESGEADLSLQPSFRLPQDCSDDQVPKDASSAWRCGDDEDTTYSAGPGLGLDTTTFSILPPYRLPQGCDPESVAKLASGAWICATDDDTTYVGGTGIDLVDGPGFALNPAYRLPQGCAGDQVPQPAPGGTWTCATDDDTTYAAGRGLALDGTTFALPDGFALPQACPDGRVAEAESGAWVCADDDDTTYAAGTGLQLTGTLFDLAPTYQLPQNCQFDQIPRWTTLTWSCAHDNDTTYTAGAGLVLSGTELSLDPAHGVTLGCAEGQVMKWDGSAWVCAADTDTDTTYDSGDFATSNQTCSTGSFVRGISPTGAVLCAAPPAGEGGGTGGASISIQSLAVGNANCPNGGTAITVDETTSYACNGTNGQDGARGPAGPAGPAGSSGGASSTSPNGLFTIDVANDGIVISGPGGSFKVDYQSATTEQR